jgi:hypothetical protein
MTGRRRTFSVASLLVVRLLLIANAGLVVTVGFLCFLFVDRPAGYILAGLAWAFGGLLVGCLPLTDPYRPRPDKETMSSG